MEITEELLYTIRQRLEQVFFAKTNHKLDTIELWEDGTFNCSKSWGVSYGGTETISEIITAKDLTSDLDEMIKLREAKEEVERQKQIERQKEIEATYQRQQKAKRLADYENLKKEFGG